MKVFLLGLDGMTLNIIEPYVNAGLLPNFKKVMDDGSYGVLRSTIPPLTGPAWTSLATGKNPGKHGIFEFRKRDGYKLSVITKNTSPDAEPMWNILNKDDKRVVVVNVPFTYPPDEVNDIMVSGMMAPGVDSDFVFPKWMKSELFRIIPNYQLDVDAEVFLRSEDKDALLMEVFKITENGRILMNNFLDKYPWDLFFFTFVGPDRLQHFLWDEIVSKDSKCVKYYQLVDDILGDILNKIDDDMVLFIASDHGFTKAKKAFYINNFFSEIGLLKKRRNSKYEVNLAGNKTLTSVLNIIRSLELKKYLPSVFLDYIKKFLPKEELTEGDFVSKDTKAFLLLYGIVTINLIGRESNGTVKKEDFDEMCETIKNELLGVKDPDTGLSIVKDVLRGEEAYSGYADDIPDLLIIMNDGYVLKQSLGGKILDEVKSVDRYLTGFHDMDGFFAVYGDIINKRKINADIYDIMPTILYIMSTAIPEDVDGSVIKEVINEDFITKNKIRFQKASKHRDTDESLLQKSEKEEIKKRLKSLGYMD